MSRNALLFVACMVAFGCPSAEVLPEEPTLTIEAPVSGDVQVGEPIELRVLVDDPQDGPSGLTVTWSLAGEQVAEASSDVGGVAVSRLDDGLEEGNHRLAVAVIDSDGNETSSIVTLNALRENLAPTCGVDVPEEDGLVAAAQLNRFAGWVEDEHDPPGDLTVELEVGGFLRATAEIDEDGRWEAQVGGLEIGSRVIRVTARDRDRAECVVDRVVRVGGAPVITFLDPVVGATVPGSDFTILATAIDYEDAEFALVASWTSDVDGLLGVTQPNTIGEVSIDDLRLTAGPHAITLEVADLEGLVGAATLNVIVDGAPSTPEVTILPSEPDSDDNLGVFLTVPSVDPEGEEPSYFWQWQKNGVPEPFFDDGAVPSTQTAADQIWSVTVYAVDSIGGRSLPATATTTVTNGPPVTTAPTIWPNPATSQDTLYCIEGTTSDPEGDPTTVTFTWEVDGFYVGTGAGLTAGTAVAGESVVCIATPSAGLSTGVSVPSAPVVVDNSSPSAPGIAVTPVSPSETDALTCSVTSISNDPDGDPVTYTYAWYRDGVLQAWNQSVLPATSTAYGEGWLCEVTPWDGVSSGPSAAVGVTIGSGSSTLLDVGVEDSIYSGPYTRGFFFQAPSSMTITGLRVPDSLVGDQSVEVVRFNGGAPPEFPAETELFTSLFAATAVPGTDWIVAVIGVTSGDWIGVLGARGAGTLEASYRASGAYGTTMDGQSVTLTRLLYQGDLSVGGADALSAETTGSLGRVEVEYSVP